MTKAQQSRLGQGIDALIPSFNLYQETTVSDKILMIPIEKLRPGPFQPRMEIDESAIEELAQSIKAHGIIQPILAREPKPGSDFYEIIAGERRWRAAQVASLHEVPVVVKKMSDQSAMAVALIENIQREDLNPIEEAKLLRRLNVEFSLKHEEIAETVGKSRATVTNLIRLLSLTEPVVELLTGRKIEAGHGKVLLALEGEQQMAAAEQVVSKGLSVRKTEELVKKLKTGKPTSKKPPDNPDIMRLELKLSDRINAKVSINDRNGKGFVKIRYHSLDELDGILERIG